MGNKHSTQHYFYLLSKYLFPNYDSQYWIKGRGKWLVIVVKATPKPGKMDRVYEPNNMHRIDINDKY